MQRRRERLVEEAEAEAVRQKRFDAWVAYEESELKKPSPYDDSPPQTEADYY